jgi:hypothetical protein
VSLPDVFGLIALYIVHIIVEANIIGDGVILFVRLVLHCNCGIGTKMNSYFGGWHAASTSRIEKIEL